MVTWSGTFLLILLPGLAVGGMLGYAEHVRRTTQLPHARWLVWAPMVLAIGVGIDVVMRGPTVEQGLGQIIGGVVISALPVSGAYAIAGHRKWLRVVCAALALSPIPLWILKATDIGGPSLGLTEPKGAWVAIYLWSFVAVIVIATTIPLRIPPRRP
ncbi:MAG: hypothetical protein KDB69_06615 [Acidimicrobiia bacterium]|nr:hypothetical protein [Acidimicrobiia bacterium]